MITNNKKSIKTRVCKNFDLKNIFICSLYLIYVYGKKVAEYVKGNDQVLPCILFLLA